MTATTAGDINALTLEHNGTSRGDGAKVHVAAQLELQHTGFARPLPPIDKTDQVRPNIIRNDVHKKLDNKRTMSVPHQPVRRAAQWSRTTSVKNKLQYLDEVVCLDGQKAEWRTRSLAKMCTDSQSQSGKSAAMTTCQRRPTLRSTVARRPGRKQEAGRAATSASRCARRVETAAPHTCSRRRNREQKRTSQMLLQAYPDTCPLHPRLHD